MSKLVWTNFVYYVSNLYTNKDDINNLFDAYKADLKIS